MKEQETREEETREEETREEETREGERHVNISKKKNKRWSNKNINKQRMDQKKISKNFKKFQKISLLSASINLVAKPSSEHDSSWSADTTMLLVVAKS